MICTTTIILKDGTTEIQNIEIPDSFFESPPPKIPTLAEKNRADIDFIALMMGVDL